MSAAILCWWPHLESESVQLWSGGVCHFSNLLYIKPRPLPYDESLDSYVPMETAFTQVPWGMTATVITENADMGPEFDEFIVYQSTDETRINEVACCILTARSVRDE